MLTANTPSDTIRCRFSLVSRAQDRPYPGVEEGSTASYDEETLAAGKRHFKNDTRRSLIPQYCQQGVLRDGGRDWLSGRREGKQPRSLVQDVLRPDGMVHHLKRKWRASSRQDQGKEGAIYIGPGC